MFNIPWRSKAQALIATLIAGIMVLAIASCNERIIGADNKTAPNAAALPMLNSTQSGISEVSPPAAIQALNQTLGQYRPQVTILNPQPEEVISSTALSAKFQVKNLQIFKDSELGMGPHLNIILDNQPSIPIYDLNQPLVLSNLTPGTHTLRVFATRPWDESFKNEGAYAQTRFHVFTKTDDNSPAADKPLLTYVSPQGSYGAEPILVDFYLTNAPLHLVAQQNQADKIADWRIRCTINGESFVFDRWQAIYLKGFKQGTSWIQLEFIDEQGNTVKNVFNNTVRLISYEPQVQDSLAKLVSGKLSASEARGIVEPYAVNIPTPTPVPIPTPESEPEVEQTETPAPIPTPESEPEVEQTETPAPIPTPESEIEQQQQPEATKTDTLPQQKPARFFNRFRRSQAPPNQNSEVIETLPPPQREFPAEPSPKVMETPTPPPSREPKPAIAPDSQPKAVRFFDRFRHRGNTPHNLPNVLYPTPSNVAPEAKNLDNLIAPEKINTP